MLDCFKNQENENLCLCYPLLYTINYPQYQGNQKTMSLRFSMDIDRKTYWFSQDALVLFSLHILLGMLLLGNDADPSTHLETHQDEDFCKFDIEEDPYLSHIGKFHNTLQEGYKDYR